jgi:hypothetical protein
MPTPKKNSIALSPSAWRICESKMKTWGFESVEEVGDFIIKTWALGTQINPNTPETTPTLPRPIPNSAQPALVEAEDLSMEDLSFDDI